LNALVLCLVFFVNGDSSTILDGRGIWFGKSHGKVVEMVPHPKDASVGRVMAQARSFAMMDNHACKAHFGAFHHKRSRAVKRFAQDATIRVGSPLGEYELAAAALNRHILCYAAVFAAIIAP
jgi:hypothetical protein